MSKWTSSANEATRLRLVGAPPPYDEVFHPEFTYPIFGDAETIFGYKGLNVQLSFASGRLTPALRVSYDAKNTLTAAKLDDIEGTLFPFLPEQDMVSPDELSQIAMKDAQGSTESFKPHGELVHEYKRAVKDKAKSSIASLFSARSRPRPTQERTFSIYHATWDTPGFKDWHARLQIMTLFYIEGASYIQNDEEKWEFYTIFERVSTSDGEAFHFVGFTSLYRFWCWPGKTRLRLSQFLILPPYQRQAHGTELYNTVYDRMLADDDVCELAVEDPSEAFDGLRDACDLARLSKPQDPLLKAVVSQRLKPPVDRRFSENLRAQYKMAARQWARMLEIILLQHLDQTDIESAREYRLQVKKRLHLVNREVLQQLDRVQRLKKLHETFESVLEEYSEMSGVELSSTLLDAPEIQVDVSALELPPMAKRAANAIIEHGEDGEDDQGARKIPRL
ncbi:histone acetyltransferase [Malassezia yamatoensis]|uniref:Histone acetyltransferase type B catalytic subunit n=1 Tax=Malassezia yamatoensis TaxID=253288 RepID=A0AAJ5YSD0_9BASI|nr:histone acetyltransferase [Malassezia yamatoensis]